MKVSRRRSAADGSARSAREANEVSTWTAPTASTGTPHPDQPLRPLVENARAVGVELTPDQVRLFDIYLRELLDWNQRVNLTAIADPVDVQVKHFADSLACLLAFPKIDLAQARLIDVGTGAGFPGMPLKILRPELCLTLLDSTRKKTLFLEHLAKALGLPDVTVLTARAEEAGRDPAHREVYDLVTSRAVAEMAALAELCLPFARVGGRMIAQKKADIHDELRGARRAIGVLGGRLLPVQAYGLPGLPEPRWLVIVEKVRPTPPQYPRRVGLPARKPL